MESTGVEWLLGYAKYHRTAQQLFCAAEFYSLPPGLYPQMSAVYGYMKTPYVQIRDTLLRLA